MVSSFAVLLGLSFPAFCQYPEGTELLVKNRLEGNPITALGNSEDKVVVKENSVLIVRPDLSSPSWAVAVEVVSKGKRPEFLIIGKRMLAENTEVRSSPKPAPEVEQKSVDELARALKEISEGNRPPVCPDPATGNLALPARDRDWTWQAARDFIAHRNFNRPVEIVSRETWGAVASRPMNTMTNIDGIVIHHTATPEDKRIHRLQQEHMARETSDGKLWADIGYHYLIGQDAKGNPVIYEGRPIGYQGAHTGSKDGKNLNPGKIGIVIIGNYEPFGRRNPSGYRPGTPEYLSQPSPGQLDLLGQLMTKLIRENPGIKQIYSHGQGTAAINPGDHSACPGKGCLHVVDAFKERLKL